MTGTRRRTAPIQARAVSPLVALLLLLPSPAAPHSGQVALAYPVADLTLDGDLSDWPAYVRPLPLTRPGPPPEPGQAPPDQGSLRVGYSEEENVLYLGIEMPPGSGVLGAPAAAGAPFTASCHLRLDPWHGPFGQGFGEYVLHGEELRPHHTAPPLDIQFQWKPRGDRMDCEWRIEGGDRVRFRAGVTVGLNVGIDLLPEEDYNTWYRWAEGSFPGDIVLAGDPTGTGGLRGRLTWDGTDAPVTRGLVLITPPTENQFCVYAVSDRTGAFAVDLPEGEYTVQVVHPARDGPSGWALASVVAAEVRDIAVTVRPPTVLRTPAGPGKFTRAGPGRRQGRWHSLHVPDGLPSNSIQDIHQTRDGCLWLATRRGVSRYDGERFLTFTSGDALAGDNVTRILEGRSGHLWFLTERGGVSRYDGSDFLTFTTADGLGPGQLTDVIQDRSGHLWFGTGGGGVTRYDGRTWSTLTMHDGLAGNNVTAVHEDRAGNLWFGTDLDRFGFDAYSGGGVTRYDGEHFVTFDARDGHGAHRTQTIFEDREGRLWFGTVMDGVTCYDGQTWTKYTAADGLANNSIQSIHQDREGYLWFGTAADRDGWGASNGVSRYDGEQFVTFTTEDGLAGNSVAVIFEDREGSLWFGTGGGLTRYDGHNWTTFTTADGLTSNQLTTILFDRAGQLWVGSSDRGVSRYDGAQWTGFTSADGLGADMVRGITEDRQGQLWFGTMPGGVTRYDGKHWTTFTTEHGLAHNRVYTTFEDRSGKLWFGTEGGGVSTYDGERFVTQGAGAGLPDQFVIRILEDRFGHFWFGACLGPQRGGLHRYDGESWTSFTTENGLLDRRVNDLFEDRDGQLWVATWGALSRYDGSDWTTYTTDHGLGSNWTTTVCQDRAGHLWFGTKDGGVSRFDGEVFQTLTQQDGLANDQVWGIAEDAAGRYWFATAEGLTRYTPPSPAPPPVRITAVTADRRYEEVEYVDMPSTVSLVTFEFHGVSLRTRPEAMRYRYHLQGVDDGWRTTRGEGRAEYADLPTGTYTFTVQAVDRDLVRSNRPARLTITVSPPFGTIALQGGLALALVALVAVSGYALKKRRALFRGMERELQTAHDMQMGLMPTEPPDVPGYELAGVCLPASQVGGDFYQYFRQNGHVAVALADVTGHAMEAAIPVMMFSGLLERQMQVGGPVEELFDRLNRSLHSTLGRRTFVCCTVAQLDPMARRLRISSGGCPFPLHYRAGLEKVEELRLSAYPLGALEDTVYEALEVGLAPMDCVVFCSDGIAETRNAAGDLFGFDRTEVAVRQACREGTTAEAVVDRVVAEVQAFAGAVPQEDDQTVVVLRVEGAVGTRGPAEELERQVPAGAAPAGNPPGSGVAAPDHQV